MTGNKIKLPLGELLEYTVGGVWGEDPGTLELDVPVYRQTEFNDDGRLGMPADAVRSVSRSQIKRRTLQSGDILLQKAAGTATLPGRVVEVNSSIESPATFSNFLQMLRPRTDICAPGFAFLVFWNMHKVGNAFEFQRGTNIKNLDLPSYLSQQIELPSIDAQKRIVDLISSMDSYSLSLQGQLAAAARARNAFISEQLESIGDKLLTLADVAEWGSGGTPKADEKSYYGGEIPWCVIGDLTEDEVVSTEKSLTSGGLQNSSAKIIEPNSVLLAMYGASIGRTGISAIRMATNQAIAYAKCNESLVIPRYLLIYLQTQKSHFVARGQGAAQANISQAIIKEWPMPVPSLVQQERIVDLVSDFDRLLVNTKSSLRHSIELRSSLLSTLLSGEHIIPPSYDKVIGTSL